MNKWAFTAALLASSVGIAHAQDLEGLLEGKAQESSPVASQETRLSFAVSTLLDKATAEQRTFLRYLETQSWNKALLQYAPAFSGTSFEKTENGIALQALLKYRSGLQITGLEQLFTIQTPKKVHSEILQSWKDDVGDKNPNWEIARLQWAPEWTEIFGRGAEIRTKLKSISLKADIEVLKDLASKTPINTRERALIDWQLALSYALNDKADEAAKVLAQLLKNPKSPISNDLVNITAGRLLYQNGYFDAAIKYYEKIGKKSDYWLEAQEELGWGYLRKGQPQNSLAVSKTLMNPAFAGYVGPESYFVESLGHLKVCDYPKVMESLIAFPKLYKSRTLGLKMISENATQELVTKTLNRMKTQVVTWQDLGKDAHQLPRMITRDQKIEQLLKVQVVFEREAKAAEALYGESLAMTGFQSVFEQLSKSIKLREQNAKNETLSRVQELAKDEVAETKKILDKLHIVEAEVIQQIDLVGKVQKNASTKIEEKKGITGAKTVGALVFPAENEVWFDELSNYKVDVKKGCQAVAR